MEQLSGRFVARLFYEIFIKYATVRSRKFTQFIRKINDKPNDSIRVFRY